MSEQTHKALLEVLNGAFTIKSVKTDFGHDRMGAMGNVFFNNKKAYEFHDDGWGGEAEVLFFDEDLKQPILDFAKEKELASVLYTNGWDFLDDVSEINDDIILSQIAEALIYNASLQKIQKQLQREMKAGIVFGTDDGYRTFKFKGISDMSEVLKFEDGLKLLQETYDRAKSELRDGQRIFNTDEQLKGLGLKV